VASWLIVWFCGALSSDQRVCLTQRPSGVCERSWRFHSSHLVGRARCEAHDVEGVKADLGVRDGLADGALVLAAHVDRDRPDRLAPVAEQPEEAPQGLTVAAGGAPHDRPGLVVGDGGQVAVMAAIGDLVDADADQAGEPVLVELIGGHPLDDRPDRMPADPQQPRDRRERHLLRQPATTSSKSRVWRAPGRTHGTGSSRTPQTGQRSRRSSHSIQQRLAPRSRCRQRLTRRSWICK
jgi:hypothetical protein